jgi:hypothetical protein
MARTVEQELENQLFEWDGSEPMTEMVQLRYYESSKIIHAY